MISHDSHNFIIAILNSIKISQFTFRRNYSNFLKIPTLIGINTLMLGIHCVNKKQKQKHVLEYSTSIF